jgi:predicted nucleic acid-binding Zn ribbon protein
MPRAIPHKHIPVTTRAIRQRNGIPFEVERRICSKCQRVLAEQPVKRTAT